MPKPKILVVDDEPQMLSLLGEVLARSGAEPHCTISSWQAAELINRRKFDAIFLDWLMPQLNGLELTKRIRWSKSNSRCPIVMLTGNTEPRALRECFHAGVNLYLQKPVSVREITRLLNASRGMILQERRRYHRVPLQTPVLCEWELESFRQKTKGVSVNVSSSGMLVKLGTTPPQGALADLQFNLPDDPQSFTLSASVIRLAPGQQVGLQFHGLTQALRERLAAFVDRILRKQLGSYPFQEAS